MVNQKKIGVILSYLTIIVNMLVQFAYTPIMLRLLGQREYGVYTLSNSVLSYLTLFDMGFADSYLRFFASYKAKKDEEGIIKLNSTFCILFCFVSVIALICGIQLSLQLRHIFNKSLSEEEINKAKIVMIILSFSLSISLMTNVFSSIITAYERFLRLRLVKLLSTVFSPLIGIPLMLMGYGSISLAVASLVTTAWCFIDYGRYCIKKLGIRFSFCFISKNLIFNIGRFSFFIFLNEIISQINWNLDKILLGYYYGTIETAIYGVGSQIDSVYRSFSSSISYVFAPQVNRLVAEGDNDNDISKLFCRIGRLQWIVIAPVLFGFIGFGKFFIKIWAGKEYNVSYYIALLLIIPVSVPLIQNIGIEVQRAKNKHQFRSIIYSFMALLNICLSIPMCKKYGAVGCAIGTAISLVIGNGIIMNWFYQKKLNIKISQFWKEIFSLSRGMLPAILFIVIILILPVEFTISRFIFFLFLFLIIYFSFMWIWGFNSNEKQLIISCIKRIR